MIKKRVYILIILTILSLSVTIFSIFVINSNKNKTNLAPVYRLKAYENNVALYKDEEIITVYEEIVLNSLPKYDQETFKNGIIVSEIEKINELLEDYE